MRVVLNESQFTNIAKLGVMHQSDEYGRYDMRFTKNDMRLLVLGESIQKDGYDIRTSLNLENAKEIIKRSPLFSDIYYEID